MSCILVLATFIRFTPGSVSRWLFLGNGLFAASLFFFTFHLVSQGNGRPLLLKSVHWFSSLELSLRLDPLSLIFTTIISGIGALIFIYAFFYLKTKDHPSGFFSALSLFMFSMLGLVLADNLLLFFICWELTTITSYLLISRKHEDKSTRDAALKALMTSFLGGLALLVAIILMGSIDSSLSSFSGLLQDPSAFIDAPQTTSILCLLFIAAFTKSAQFPFHYWLPAAMKAPTPVSAYLHSATMVNAGIYLLARLHPLFCHLPLWYPILTVVGIVTMFVGAFLSLRETDLKLILAYTTLFALGSMTYLLAGDTYLAMVALVVFLIAHALYKASLFMMVGYLDKRYGSRDISTVQGLWKHAPIAAVIWTISTLSMAGFPFFFGFMTKQLMFEIKLAKASLSLPLELMSLIPSVLIAFRSMEITFSVLKSPKSPIPLKQGYSSLLWSPGILALGTLIPGFMPGLLDHTQIFQLLLSSLLDPKTEDFRFDQYTVHDQSALFSLLVFGLGLLFYLLKRPFLGFVPHGWLTDFKSTTTQKKGVFFWLRKGLKGSIAWGPDQTYQRVIDGVILLANWTNKTLQSGDLRFYLGLIFTSGSLLLAVGAIQISPETWQTVFVHQRLSLIDILLAAFTFCSAAGVIWFGAALSSLIALGIFGLSMAMIFLLHGAVDVAMTQLLVELLLLIFFVISIYRLGLFETQTRKKNNLSLKGKGYAITIAIFFGACITVAMYLVLKYPLDNTVNQFYLHHSLPSAHGKNVVNVILIDFRALDTLGEILVIAASAIGIFGLLKNHEKLR
jgi:multicomponent Na+:H+ antiporter subunit A